MELQLLIKSNTFTFYTMKYELQRIISGEAKLSMEQLSKQSPITLAEARAQAVWLKNLSTSKNKKQKS